MDAIVAYFDSIGVSFDGFAKTALFLLLGSLLLSLLGRFVFGRKSVLSNAVSSAVEIVFIYLLTVIIKSAGAEFDRFITPLPFVTMGEESLVLFSFTGAHYTTICSELLSMIILAFLVNLADSWIPDGKSVFGWLFFRCLTVAVGYLLHLVTVTLFAMFLPEGLVTYAPTVLLWILIALLLTGALKIVVGVLLSSVHPVIGGLYTFFFATILGKRITRAILTTLLLTGLVFALQYAGVSQISIVNTALIAYIPFILLLIAMWFLISRIL
jgi:hypothetical protein